MDPFEYFIVLQSLILGLGIAQILTGAADAISNLKNVKLGVAHTLMVFIKTVAKVVTKDRSLESGNFH